jgi:hypothetical protein
MQNSARGMLMGAFLGTVFLVDHNLGGKWCSCKKKHFRGALGNNLVNVRVPVVSLKLLYYSTVFWQYECCVLKGADGTECREENCALRSGSGYWYPEFVPYTECVNYCYKCCLKTMPFNFLIHELCRAYFSKSKTVFSKKVRQKFS